MARNRCLDDCSMTFPNRPDWAPETFEQITDLLAEALFQDFQQHVRATVNSPQGLNQRIPLTHSELNDNGRARGETLDPTETKYGNDH